MQNLISTFLILSSVLFLSSCLKQSESITPITPVQTLAQMQREAMMMTALSAGQSEFSDSSTATVAKSAMPDVFYLNLKYRITDMDLYESTDIPNNFEKLSNIFVRTVAKIFLRIKGSQSIEVDPVELDLPDMNLDFDIVKSVKIKRVYLEYNKAFDTSIGNKASFSFLSSLNMKRVGRNKSLLVSYNKVSNACNFKCLDFKVEDGDIFELLKNNSQSVILKPSLSIVSLPKVMEMRLDGQIELQIGLKLPF